MSFTGLKAQLSINADPVSGCDTLAVQFKLLPLSGSDTIHTITWDFGNGIIIAGVSDPLVEFNSPGIYTVSCQINNSVTLTATNLIDVRKGPVTIFTFTDTLESGLLNKFFNAVPQPVPANTYSYYWEISDGSTYSASSFIHTFLQTGTYNILLTIADQTGCSDTTVSEVVAGNLIDVPNVFSPNGDNINDYLRIRTNGINLFSLDIYTRAGVLVYKSESFNLIWDGRSFSGHELSPGIYYYIIRQIDGDAGIEKRGFVHLVR